ncbi:SUKH-4 family immunity protein [Micromonospora sp. SD19]|uniref:SUKH-4 family immunity protein n=1 Tax=Micromonospora sp. C97 TaxID=2824883 RepID=UPI001B381FA1|nr:SUKH-4 family immunity protein [Micromonospora sp. C97]MBQ1032449.1 SUKH-4 family immunity protein [Micromonospora sp. C97]
MNAELRQLIEELRADLADLPESLAYAEFGEGAAIDAVPAGLPADLRDLLLVTDGIRAGRVELASTSTLPGIQYHLDYAPDFSAIPQNRAGWLVIGTRSDEPVFMDRGTGAIWYFPPTGTEWFMSDAFEELAPDVESFVDYYLLGPGYADLTPADDRWFAFLDEQGLLDEDDEDDEDPS